MMELQQVVNQAFQNKDYFIKNNVSIVLNSPDGELLTIPAKLIFSNNWVITREITEESSPSLFKTVIEIFKGLNGGKPPKPQKPRDNH